METKKILDFVEKKEDYDILDLNNPEVQKLYEDETQNIYNIFGSIYHTKLEKSTVVENARFSDGTKFNNKFTEGKIVFTCLYCARDHEEESCPFTICKKCGEKGHISTKCNKNFCIKKSTLCKKCSFTSHSEFDCPDAYRKYKITKITTTTKSCGNCAGEHYTNDCPTSLENSKFSVFSEKYINYKKSQIEKK